MIALKDVYKMIEKLDKPYVRVLDYSNNILCTFETGGTAKATVKDMEETMPLYAGYNKVIIKATDENGYRGNYKVCHKWDVFFDSVPKGAAIAAQPQPNNFGGVPEWMFRMMLQNQSQQVPAGYVPQAVVEANNANVAMQINHLKEMFELKKAAENPIDKYMGLIPVAMYALGKSPDDIAKVTGAMGSMSKIGSPNTAAQTPSNTLTFGDVDKLTNEEKNALLSKIFDELQQKISVQEMIILFEALNKNPELKNIGKLAAVVQTDKLNKLITGLINKPTLADAAINFL